MSGDFVLRLFLHEPGVVIFHHHRPGRRVYASKNLERMRAFFRFCEQARWVDRDPAASVKAPKVKRTPTLPFSAEEMKRILDACDQYPGNADRMKAFVLTMRHSGLRIGDTIALKEQMRVIAVGGRDHVSGRLLCEIWEVTADEWREQLRRQRTGGVLHDHPGVRAERSRLAAEEHS